ncbi:hypothetical protein ScPMuIL_010601 [Solemya velum]
MEPAANGAMDSSHMKIFHQTVTVDDERSLCRSSSYLSDGDFGASYGTLLTQIQEAKAEAETLCEFMTRIFNVLWTTMFTAAILILLMGLPISMIAVGSSYRDECPKEPKIPIYLLVGGVFGLIKIILLLWNHRKTLHYELLDDDDDLDDMENALHIVAKAHSHTL